MRRRDFLKAGGAVAVAPGVAPGSRVLGPDRIPLSRVAMGTGTKAYAKSSNQTRKLGYGGTVDLLRFGFDQGITLWDSADGYGTHPHIREALKGVPREKVAILTKTRARTAAEMRADLDRFRRELGCDYLDIVLLHAMMAADWPRECQGAMDVLAEAREKKIVRTHGCSCHSLDALRTAAKTPWVRVQLARINFAGINMDAGPQQVVPVLREMKAGGKGVIGMKILGEGELRGRADEALRYALGLDCLDCFTVGFESRDEVKDLTRRVAAA